MAGPFNNLSFPFQIQFMIMIIHMKKRKKKKKESKSSVANVIQPLVQSHQGQIPEVDLLLAWTHMSIFFAFFVCYFSI